MKRYIDFVGTTIVLKPKFITPTDIPGCTVYNAQQTWCAGGPPVDAAGAEVQPGAARQSDDEFIAGALNM